MRLWLLLLLIVQTLSRELGPKQVKMENKPYRVLYYKMLSVLINFSVYMYTLNPEMFFIFHTQVLSTQSILYLIPFTHRGYIP